MLSSRFLATLSHLDMYKSLSINGKYRPGRCGTDGDEELIHNQLNSTANEYRVLISILARG